jgi:hypothetical protein
LACRRRSLDQAWWDDGIAVATLLRKLVPAVKFEHLDEFSELHWAGRYLSGARWGLG